MDIKFPIINLRPYQLDAFKACIIPDPETGKTFKQFTLLWSRRAGKDLTALQLVTALLLQKRRKVSYLFPYSSQARAAIWTGMTKDSVPYLNFIPKEVIEKVNQQTMTVTFINGSILKFGGSENLKANLGQGFYAVVYSEFDLHRPDTRNLMRPIVLEQGGIEIFIYTSHPESPIGEEHWKRALENSDHYTSKVIIDDLQPWLDRPVEEIINNERKLGMSESKIRSEYYLDFSVNIENSFYSYVLENCTDQIVKNLYRRDEVVYTAWDIGFSDSTSIWFFQIVDNQLHLIDYLEDSGKSADLYCQHILNKPYIYAKHFLPHDSKQHSWSDGKTKYSVVKKMLQQSVEPLAQTNNVMNDIDIVRRTLWNIYFDEDTTAVGYRLISRYKEKVTKDGLQTGKPDHDETSHAADGLRYAVVAFNKLQSRVNRGPLPTRMNNSINNSI